MARRKIILTVTTLYASLRGGLRTHRCLRCLLLSRLVSHVPWTARASAKQCSAVSNANATLLFMYSQSFQVHQYVIADVQKPCRDARQTLHSISIHSERWLHIHPVVITDTALRCVYAGHQLKRVFKTRLGRCLLLISCKSSSCSLNACVSLVSCMFAPLLAEHSFLTFCLYRLCQSSELLLSAVR